MAINKVNYGNQTIIDLTDANVTAEALPKGITAYDKNGNLLEGTADFVKWPEQNIFGAKNIMPPMPDGWGDGSGETVSYGVTYTVNDDYTITQNGTASGGHANIFTYNNVNANSNRFKLPYGVKVGDKLRLTGCPSGGSNTTYYLRLHRITQSLSRASIMTDVGNGATLTITQADLDAYGFIAQICLDNGNTANNNIFRPMLTLESIPDTTYAPPAMTNLQLTKKVQELESNAKILTRETFSESITSGTKYTKQLTGYNASTSWIDAFINGLALQDSEFTVSAAGLFSLVNTLTGSGNTIKVIHWKQGS